MIVHSKRLDTAVLLLGLIVIPSGSTRADVVYSNLGPGGAFDTFSSDAIDIANSQQVALEFTSPGNFLFQDAQLALARFQGSGEIDVNLDANFAGQPGVTLEHLTGIVSSGPSLITFDSLLHPLLTSSPLGSKYWLVLYATDATSRLGWYQNSINDIASNNDFLVAHHGPTGPWTNSLNGSARPAFQIDGTPFFATAVPEPGSLALLAMGAIGLAG